MNINRKLPAQDHKLIKWHKPQTFSARNGFVAQLFSLKSFNGKVRDELRNKECIWLVH